MIVILCDCGGGNLKVASSVEYLNEVLQRQKISKNDMIRNIHIDRSTFFRILAGRREAKPDQFCRILSQIYEDQDVIRQLILEYLSGDSLESIDRFEQVDRWMERLHEAEDHPVEVLREQSKILEDQAVLKAGHGTVTKQLLSEFRKLGIDNQQVYLYVSVQFFACDSLWPDIADMLQYLLKRDRIQVIIDVELDEQDNLENRLAMLFCYLYGIYHVSKFTDLVHCIYDTQSSNYAPFPYFAVDGNRLMLIDHTGTKMIEDNNPLLIKSYRDFFAELEGHTVSYVQKYDSINEVVFSYYQRYQQCLEQGIQTKLIEQRPCVLKLATPEMITRYMPNEVGEFMRRYVSTFQQLNVQCLHSASGLEYFQRDHEVDENGMRIQVDQMDFDAAIKLVVQSGIEDMTFLTDWQDHLSLHWDFILFDDGELTAVPNWDCPQVISIRDECIISAFNTWFTYSREMAGIRKRTEQYKKEYGSES